MTTRREFIVGAGAGLMAMGAANTGRTMSAKKKNPTDDEAPGGPVVVSTWRHGVAANEAAWPVLGDGGRALDAVEKGVMVTEADPEVTSVGYGGLPDRDGKVTLDACIMDENGNAGAVAFLQDFLHPISIARRVMEETPHVMLAGEGAHRFALDQGFETTDLLTESSRRAWHEWTEETGSKPFFQHGPDDHDTISMLALDADGNLAGSCTTSGMAYKMHGRVGDSPIIGAALFVDNEVGAACATGMGEEVMKTLGSFLIVELMRQGATPQEACEEGVRRIIARHEDIGQVQVGYLALDRLGNVGAYDIQPWFQYAITRGDGDTRLVDADSHRER
jgi:isoaspartyl peptidase/L-asparaginase-like protein (Ntn-hydrolase superfamily)